MKKTLTTAILFWGTMTILSTTVEAGPQKGQKIFKKKLRKKCGFSGVRFARSHTRSEWEELWDTKKFQDEAKKICPKLDIRTIKPNWWKDVYEFSHKYASDGMVPKC